jgi:hypothetical protein
MIGRRDLPVRVLNRLAVLRQLHSVIGLLHPILVIPLTRIYFRGYHLRFARAMAEDRRWGANRRWHSQNAATSG